MNQILDIIDLIENNPIKNFNKEYQNKFIEKIKQKFNENQINLFVASFYSYLNYNQETDYVIELENIWKWLGFSRKDFCKVLLEKHFEKDRDYIIKIKEKTASVVTEAKNKENRGGHNKEIITMNIKTFKKLCLKTATQKADEIHDYFITLEEIFHEIINEESNELKEQLKLKDKELIKKEIEALKNNEKYLLKEFHEKDVVYLIKVEDNLYKFGATSNIKRRIKDHYKFFGTNIIVVYCIESKDHFMLENKLKEYLTLTNYRMENEYLGKFHTELIDIKDNQINIIIDKIKELNDLKTDTRKIILELKNKIIELETELEQYKLFKTTIIPKDVYNEFINNELDFNKDNRVTLTMVSKNFYEFLKNNNNYKNYILDDATLKKNKFNYKKFELELIKYIKFKYNNTVIYREGDRTTRSVFINLCLKNYSSFYKNEVYENFINETYEIKNDEKIEGKLYKYKENVANVMNKFLKYVEKNNIESFLVGLQTSGEFIRMRELKKNICKICNCKIAKNLTYDGVKHVSFIGIKLKEKNDYN